MEEFLEENFKNIGQLLEGAIKPYLKLLLNICRIKKSKKYSIKELNSLDLGALVNELIINTDFPELFQPPPWNIRLNQWRNIAYHHSAKIVSGKIICSYGKSPKIKTIELTRSELLKLTKTIMNVFNTFRNVEFIFLHDNLVDFQKACKQNKYDDFIVREEVKLLELFSKINSQGFKIIELKKENNDAYLIIEDMTDGDIKERSCHSSLFLYHLWFYTKMKNLKIEYRLKGGKPFLISKTDETICEKIGKGEKEIEYLAEKAVFNFLNKS